MTKAETHLAELLKKVSNHSSGSLDESGNASSADESASSDGEKLFLALSKMLSKNHQSQGEKDKKQGLATDPANSQILSNVMDSFQQEIAVSVRHEMAKQIAGQSNPPIELALNLATDPDLEVARPILATVNFSDAELIQIIEQTTHDHHMVIAKRGDLTKPVWKALTRQRMQAERHRFQRPPHKPQQNTNGAKSHPGAEIEKIDHHRVSTHQHGSKAEIEDDLAHQTEYDSSPSDAASHHIMEKLDAEAPAIPSFLMGDATDEPFTNAPKAQISPVDTHHYHEGKAVFPPPNDVPLLDNDGTDDLVEGILHQTPDHDTGFGRGSETISEAAPSNNARFGSKYQALKNRNPLQTDDSQRDFDVIKKIAAQMALKAGADPVPNHDEINWQEEENASQSAIAEKALHHVQNIINREDSDDIDDVDVLAHIAEQNSAPDYDFEDSLSDALEKAMDVEAVDLSHQLEKTNQGTFDDHDYDDGRWQFRTDRNGKLDQLDQVGTHYLGGDAGNLKEAGFFDKMASDEPETLHKTVHQHQPIRDMVVQIEAPDGSPRPWKLRAKARFDPVEGKFLGYEGTAMPMDPAELESRQDDWAGPLQSHDGSLGGLQQQSSLQKPSQAASKALLQKLFLRHLSQTTAQSTRHLAELAVQLLEDSQQSQNRTMMHHALQILEQSRTVCHQLENVGVLDETIASNSSLKRGRKYALKRVMEEVLDEDAIIEGEAARYYIDPSANTLETNFDSALLRKILSRMVLVARKFGSRESDRLIKITSSISGHLIVRIPLGTTDQLSWSINDVLFDPVQAMKNGLKGHDSNNLSRMAAFSLSAMKPAAQKEGADIKIIRTSGNMRELILDIQS